MGKKQLLFVTYGDENPEEGLSYAIELAKVMYQDITLLLVQKKSRLMDKMDTLMTAVTFAEAGEHDAARKVMLREKKNSHADSGRKIADLITSCKKEGISVSIKDTNLDFVSGIRSFLANHTGIDKVVLSPSVSETGGVTAKILNRFVRAYSLPIVTMTRPAVAAGNWSGK